MEMQMEDYLYQKDLWKPLEGKTKKLTAMLDKDWDILNRKALGTIQLCLAQSVTFNITKEKMTKELMKKLAKLYKKPSASNKVFLIKYLFNMKIVEGGSIADHLNEFNIVTSQLSYVNFDFMKKLGLS